MVRNMAKAKASSSRIAVIGLGKLGLPIALLFGTGYKVIGVDTDEKRVKAINSCTLKSSEAGVMELLQEKRNRRLNLYATTDMSYAINSTDIAFIIVPTPSLPDNTFSTTYICNVIKNMGQSLRYKTYYTVVVCSTVLPGDMDSIITPALEKASRRIVGNGIGLCYNPEFVALGSVIRDFTHPDIILIGESDSESGNKLIRTLQGVMPVATSIHRMNFRNAELTKIALNTYVTMKISYANMLAGICEKMPGGDVDIVTRAIGSDSRIGAKYLRGGTSFGGPCFVRDSKAFTSMADRMGCYSYLPMATTRMNEVQGPRIVNMVIGRLGKLSGKRVAVLGMTYKPDTDVVEESAGMLIAQQLALFGAEVRVHDPMGMENVKGVLGPIVEYHDTIAGCLKNADIAIIATPWKQYSELSKGIFGRMRKKIVLDCWRILPEMDGVEVIALGKCNE